VGRSIELGTAPLSSDWLPAATLAAGVLGTLGGQGLREWRTSGREREARRAERQVARDAFQRETLLELQDAILEMVRLTSKLHIYHRRVFAESGRWSRDPEPDDLAEAHRLTIARMAALKQRVLDGELRAELGHLQEGCAEITEANFGEDDAWAAERASQRWIALAHANRGMEDHLGRILRQVL
jgi:hypothetical protein